MAKSGEVVTAEAVRDDQADAALQSLIDDGGRHRILVVDDEVHILKAIKRLLMDYELEVLTAEDGYQALEILEGQSVAVIVSDQRMPGISGAELLRRVRLNYPTVVRVMLTGNSDLTTAINAINDGEVFRFVTKPWQLERFVRIIELALEQYELQHAKALYEAYIESQNERLRTFNERLEERVAERTEEVEAQRREIGLLYGELQHSFDGMIKALLSIMELGEIHVVEHCQRTAERVRLFGETLGLGVEALRDLERAALLHWIGLINASPSVFRQAADELDAVDEATWEFHPLLGQQAIRHVPALHRPGRIILHYLNRHDDPQFKPGKPSADKGEVALSAGFIEQCQILAICSRFEQVRTTDGPGATADGEWIEGGLSAVVEQRGKAYDPRLVDRFEAMMGQELARERSSERVLSFDELRAGMVLSRPLETAQGIPVAPRDMIITDELLERLGRFRDSKGLNEIHIWA